MIMKIFKNSATFVTIFAESWPIFVEISQILQKMLPDAENLKIIMFFFKYSIVEFDLELTEIWARFELDKVTVKTKIRPHSELD